VKVCVVYAGWGHLRGGGGLCCAGLDVVAAQIQKRVKFESNTDSTALYSPIKTYKNYIKYIKKDYKDCIAYKDPLLAIITK
jgi:hypothetical protein